MLLPLGAAKVAAGIVGADNDEATTIVIASGTRLHGALSLHR